MHALHHSVKTLPALTPTLSQMARELRPRRSNAGFSLTELLVVIGIIVLLVGLLLVALGQVQKRAKRTQTESTMQQFGNACAAFQAEHGFYPGVLSDDILALSPLSSTENALLHLMGGYRVLGPMDAVGSPVEVEYQAFVVPAGGELTIGVAPNQWKIKINVQRIGEGPVINGKPYGPYYTPGTGELAIVDGQVGEDPNIRIPDLVDAWGQPIIFAKQARNRGPLVNRVPPITTRPQFTLAGIDSYLLSTGLGELSGNQDTNGMFGTAPIVVGSPPSPEPPLTLDQRDKAWSAVLGHSAFYKVADPRNCAARGAFTLISAGPDGVFFARTDGPGGLSSAAVIKDSTVDNLIINVGPRVIDEFDDVRVYGGG